MFDKGIEPAKREFDQSVEFIKAHLPLTKIPSFDDYIDWYCSKHGISKHDLNSIYIRVLCEDIAVCQLEKDFKKIG